MSKAGEIKQIWGPELYNLSSSTETIQIVSSDPDAIIRYTTDGNDPTVSSTLYEGPFEASIPSTVKARAYIVNGLCSDVSTYEVEIPTNVIGFGDFAIGYNDYVIGYQMAL